MPTIAELRRAFPGEWLAVEVLRRDEEGVALEGELLYHGRSQDEAYSRIGTTPHTVYVIHNVPLRPTLHPGFVW